MIYKEVVIKILENNPQSIADYKAGKDRALGFLVGQCMKEMKGKGNPQILNKLILEELIFPIKNGVLTMNENFENNQSLKFYLVYDIKSKLYEEQMLFELKYDFYTNDIGLIELKKENDILKMYLNLFYL